MHDRCIGMDLAGLVALHFWGWKEYQESCICYTKSRRCPRWAWGAGNAGVELGGAIPRRTVGKGGGEDTRANSCLYLDGADYNAILRVIFVVCRDVNVDLDSLEGMMAVDPPGGRGG